MYQNEIQGLYNLAVAANNVVTKSAAVGVGGQQVVPTAPYQNAAGLYDPPAEMAGYTALSEARAQINAQTILDGQPVGTNWLPYQQGLNENYQAVQAGMGMQHSPKTASAEEVNYHFQKMASSGLFPNPQLLPDMNGWDSIDQVTKSKAASMTEAQIANMINSGVLQQVRPDFIPVFLSPGQV